MTNYRTKIFITCALGLAATVILVFTVVQPLLQSTQAVNKELGYRKAELAKIERQIEEFKTAQADISRATFKDDVYDTIPIREDLSVAIQDTEVAAGLTNTIQSIQILETEATAQGNRRSRAQVESASSIFQKLQLTTEVPYSLTVQNEFDGFVEYLQYLEHLPHFTEFSSISLNAAVENQSTRPGGVSENSGLITGTLEGVFLVKKSTNNNNEAPE